MSSATHTVDAVDLFDPALFRDGPPHEIFDRLRREDPVYWSPHPGDPDGGFWALTRHADVASVSRDARFTSAQGFTAPRGVPGNPAFVENIMFRDPPDHTNHRRPANRLFTPKAMLDLEDGVRAIVLAVLERTERLAEFDWVPLVAAEIPARVVASVLGVRDEDHPKFVEWASAVFNRDETAESEARFEEAVMSMMQYSETLKVEKRACPAGDVMSTMIAATIEGAPLSETALKMWFLSLAGAGFETTHTLIAQGMVVLSGRPDVRERLRREPAAIPATVEELLRFVTPVNMMGRTALEDVELGGRTIPAGHYVTMWYAAANRDPEVFDRPHEFVMDRSPNNHQSFGAVGSPHYCLGAHLARLEMRVLLEELAARGFPYEVAGTPERMPGVFINALTRLPMVNRSVG